MLPVVSSAALGAVDRVAYAEVEEGVEGCEEVGPGYGCCGGGGDAEGAGAWVSLVDGIGILEVGGQLEEGLFDEGYKG